MEIFPSASPAPTGAVIVVHEWWGLNDDIRRIARRFSDAGFLALAVDLFAGQVATDAARARELANEMKTANALATIGDAIVRLRADERCTGRVAVTGFCLGGAMTLAAASELDGLVAAVPFYGTPRDEFLTFAKEGRRILGHYGARDTIVDAERVRGIRDRATALGVPFELHFYEAGHAFMREADPAVFDATAAALAWERTVRFLKETLV